MPLKFPKVGLRLQQVCIGFMADLSCPEDHLMRDERPQVRCSEQPLQFLYSIWQDRPGVVRT